MTKPATELIDEAADEVSDALRELVKGTQAAIATLQARVEELEAERDEALRKARDGAEEDADTITDQVEALETVRYWLLDVLCHGKVPTDPRRVLRVVERVLG